jgi:hypothetical protein
MHARLNINGSQAFLIEVCGAVSSPRSPRKCNDGFALLRMNLKKRGVGDEKTHFRYVAEHKPRLHCQF